MIFIVEDNKDRIEVFTAELGDTPFHVERTVPEAIEWLIANGDSVVLYCLDSDLYVPDYEGDAGDGWELCEWIVGEGVRAPILIHTSNSHAATKMEMACDAAEWPYTRVTPYLGTQWIAEAWTGAVRKALQ